ncbi:MAG: M20 aminoacylase family protein [Pikeienuella sp.]|uniref:M20 aminoacylase family protein n=1 Tax=Pikeienuella sp. TaxID=2831957 RepID=UPI00391AB732
MTFHHRHQNRIAGLLEEATAWRRDLHAHPEIGFEEKRTAGIVAAKLREFGVDEVHEGLARTGVLGIVRGKGEGPMIGLRADMDALPMPDLKTVPWRSKFENRNHACGHDGHTAMLLAAAKILCETRDFAGSVALIFQPAEEGMGGGKEMVEDGLFRLAPCDSVWGLHNWPGAPLGAFTALAGPVMAGVDYFDIRIRGVGTHAGTPHLGTDTVLAAGHMIAALQSVASRTAPPQEAATISVTRLSAATAYHVVPDTTEIGGSLRYVNPAIRPKMEAQLRAVAKGVAEAFGAVAEIDYRVNYPPTINPAAEADLAAQIAAGLVGAEAVERRAETCMAAEDFAFMLNQKPGHYIWMGVDAPGHTTAKLHHPEYDFNDAAIPYGVAYWLSLADRLLPRA